MNRLYSWACHGRKSLLGKEWPGDGGEAEGKGGSE